MTEKIYLKKTPKTLRDLDPLKVQIDKKFLPYIDKIDEGTFHCDLWLKPKYLFVISLSSNTYFDKEDYESSESLSKAINRVLKHELIEIPLDKWEKAIIPNDDEITSVF
tara:strand:+ start:141 stop:467 length:327 start_codon:yes stop_codon:yes gene_type:complete